MKLSTTFNSAGGHQKDGIHYRTDRDRGRYSQLTEKLNRYTFRVSPDANKFQIKDLVEKLYGVKVVNVNTCVVRGKNKSRYTKSGLLRGKTRRLEKGLCHRG